MTDFQTKCDLAEKSVFTAGESFKAVIPFSVGEPMKIHIDHVLPSIYEGRQLVIYRVYGKHKQWWHEFMCTNWDMWFYKDRAAINDCKK